MTTPFDGYGISVVVKNYCYHLKEYVDFDFLLCAGYANEEYAFFESNSFNVFVPRYSRNRHPLLYRKWLVSFLKDRHYDAVHAHGNSGTLYFDISAAKRANVGVRIAHCHNSSCNHKILHFLLKAPLNRICTTKLACSDLAGKWLFGKKFIVLNNAIDSNQFCYSLEKRLECRKRLGIHDEKVLLNVGRLHEQKNQLFLISVMEKLVIIDNSYRLLIIGDGHLKERIEMKINSSNLKNNIKLIGKSSEVEKYYSCSDLFLFPSVYEGLGLVAIEAEASGLNVLASKNVPKEINVTGNVHFLELDIDVWVGKINSLFQNALRKREDVSKTAIFEIQKNNYDIQFNCDTLFKIYTNQSE